MLRAIFQTLFGLGAQTGTGQEPEKFPGFATERDAQKAMVQSILDLRAIVKTEDGNAIETAIATFKERTNGILDEKERQGEISDATAMLTFLSTRKRLEASERPIPVDVTSEEDPRYFRAERVWLIRKRDDDLGVFEVANNAIFYNGADKKFSIPWAKLAAINVSECTLAVYRTAGGDAFEFRLANSGTAKLAHLIASMIRKQQPPQKTERRSGSNSVKEPLAVGTTFELPGAAGAFPLGIVGESRRQAVLRCLAGDRRSRGEFVVFDAAIVPEPNNLYDPNAIAVHIKGGSQVGYLSRDDAAAFRRRPPID